VHKPTVTVNAVNANFNLKGYQTAPPILGGGGVMSSFSEYTPFPSPHLNGCGTGPVIPAQYPINPLLGVYVNGIPIHYSDSKLTCGTIAGPGVGEVYCYERIPDSSFPFIFIPFLFGSGDSTQVGGGIDTDITDLGPVAGEESGSTPLQQIVYSPVIKK
jgi:hypothetical protein